MTAEVKGEWRFNNAAYLSSNQQLTSNVLELVKQLISRLSHTTQHLLSLAACIGTTFDTDTLAVVSEMTRGQVTSALREAMNEELITLQDNTARPSPPSPPSDPSSASSASSSSAVTPDCSTVSLITPGRSSFSGWRFPGRWGRCPGRPAPACC